MISELHFIRPQWFWLLLPLLLLAWLIWKQKLRGGNWQAVCDPELLPHLLIGSEGKQRRWPLWLFLLAGTLAVTAIAGPAWEKLEQPVFREQAALVIVLDVSRSMDAGDIKPSRLARARHKISDILQRRKEGQTALIVYAAQAFSVVPLTQDTETIASLLPSLETDLMPQQGSRADKGLEQAQVLLQQAGVARGDILLITDGIDARAESVGRSLAANGHRLSVLAVGTEAGAPVSISGGGFLSDNTGAIVIPKLETGPLRALASVGSGHFSRFSPDDSDINYLLAEPDSVDTTMLMDEDMLVAGMKADTWQEEGPWLLLLLLPLVALGFRRGVLPVVLLMLLPIPRPAQALEWQDLWSRPDQRAAQLLEEGKAEQAAQEFIQPEWKAAAQYRNGDYDASIKSLEAVESDDAWYNKANAHAQAGRYPEAIEAYDEALKRNAEHKDAKYNREQVMKQLSPEEQQEQNQQGDEGDNSEKSPEQQQGEESLGESQESDSGDESSQSGEEKGEQQEQNKEQQGSDSEQQDETEEQAAAAEQEQDNTETDEQQKNSAESDDTESNEQQQATEQWLRRIPDDPGGLLRRKFKYQYQRRGSAGSEEQSW